MRQLFATSYRIQNVKREQKLCYHAEYLSVKKYVNFGEFSGYDCFIILQTILVREKHTKFSN